MWGERETVTERPAQEVVVLQLSPFFLSLEVLLVVVGRAGLDPQSKVVVSVQVLQVSLT